MTRTGRQVSRSGAIDARARARRIANLRSRQVFARQSEAQRDARLVWLAQLADAIGAGAFTDAELREAQVALAECNQHQRQLDLGTSRHARA